MAIPRAREQVAHILFYMRVEDGGIQMKKRACVGLILMAGLLSGCGAHLSNHLTAGRQMPLTLSGGSISIPLTGTSEVQLNLRGFRMGLTDHGEPQATIDAQTDLTPWLRYRLHF